MRDYEKEIEARADWVRGILRDSGAKGIVYGNSGGKDCTLVSAICKRATDNVIGVIMPCHSRQNYGSDRDDALRAAEKFGIECITVDLSDTKDALCAAIEKSLKVTDPAGTNINPRLRMTVLYAVAQSKGYLVAGTGNRSEGYMGYFTKWGDGAYDLNPISDLTVTEIYEFLRYLGAPEHIITKAPSAGLFDGQTDEGEMGVTYAEIDSLLLTGETSESAKPIIERRHAMSEHKRSGPHVYEK
ncbi:MAG: NAD(+) synthase [Clostridiales bacterium]|nr:NAD(+) synthase [Clostridiales bacterium]